MVPLPSEIYRYSGIIRTTRVLSQRHIFMASDHKHWRAAALLLVAGSSSGEDREDQAFFTEGEAADVAKDRSIVNELPSLTQRFLVLCEHHGSRRLAVRLVAIDRGTGVPGLPGGNDWTAWGRV